MEYADLLHDFVRLCLQAVGDPLVGVYLHGSLAAGGFHPASSDIDLIVVLSAGLTSRQKMQLLEGLVVLNSRAPAKGIEVSFVRREVCDPFVYPTPYELHFSPAHLARFARDPEDYVEHFHGTDRDLAAHFTVLRRHGVTLYGCPIAEVFGPVPPRDYADSILCDIEDAGEAVLRDPVYTTLNLCRTLAYVREGAILSKETGGQWALTHLPEPYHPLIRQALDCYTSGAPLEPDPHLAQTFAAQALEEIKRQVELL